MEPMASEWLKFQRAQEHLKSFEALTEPIADSEMGKLEASLVRYKNARMILFRMRDVKPLPPTLSLVAGDILQNLRSSLDHLMFHLCVNENKSFPDTQFASRTYFPIFKDPGAFDENARVFRKLVSESAWATIERVQPYKTVDKSLFVVHELNRLDKHKALPIIAIVGDVSFAQFEILGDIDLARGNRQAPLQGIIRRGIPIEEGAEVALFPTAQFRDGSTLTVNMHANLKAKIVFGKQANISTDEGVLHIVRQAFLSVEKVLTEATSTLKG